MPILTIGMTQNAGLLSTKPMTILELEMRTNHRAFGDTQRYSDHREDMGYLVILGTAGIILTVLDVILVLGS